ncbi:MAG: hypothetical protein EOO13_06460 [Chitinophagaceae bacterium]|nr:MAG: hypothetical protein EOO13_06460 [Chitinophagaceae bacterium]
MYLKMMGAVILLISISCTGGQSQNTGPSVQSTPSFPTETLTNIASIPLPDGFKRLPFSEASFASFLRNISLKKDKTVYLYNGQVKSNQSAQFAVLDISVGNKDLQQCADAVMRLRAEYLFLQKKYDEIVFTDNEGGQYKLESPYNRERFNDYLQRVFGMCGTASLSKQLNSVGLMEMQTGDVFIKGGFPGHAVMVIDMAENEAGEKIYLLAQSYMPAQDIHILVNPNEPGFSPWYRLKNNEDISTPEYFFTKTQLKTW